MSYRPTIFLSYSHRDAQIATELASRFRDAGLHCFVAERDITATQRWEPRLREEIRKAKCVVLLLTPRSMKSNWVMIEAGAAWVLDTPIVPATMFVEPDDLIEPICGFQIRPVETNAQVVTLIQELQENLLSNSTTPLEKLQGAVNSGGEFFNTRESWEILQKIGNWVFDEQSGVFVGEGMHQYLVSHQTYGSEPFRIEARLRFTPTHPTGQKSEMNAGIIFGWQSVGNVLRYFNLLITGKRILLELIGANGGPVFKDYKHLDEGVSFEIRPGTDYDFDVHIEKVKLRLLVNGKQLYSTRFSGDPTGRVGLRPWRSRVESEKFTVSVAHHE